MKIDKNIVKKIKQNDRTAILQLYHHTYNLLMSIAVRYYGNKEEQMEMVNTTFMKIVDNISKFKIGTTYFSWAKRIGQNVVIDKFRSDKNYKLHFKMYAEDGELEGLKNPNENLEATEGLFKNFQAEEIEQILSHLPPASKITFNLFAMEGYTYKEIAEKLEISYETVKWHIKASRKKLKSILKENTLEIGK